MTQEQKLAANFLWQNSQRKALQVIAGAGSGKTTTLIAAVSSYAQCNGNTNKICLITFTKKAAQEMKERLNKQNISVGFIGTMHALAYQMIRKSKTTTLTIITDSDKICRELIQDKYQELRYIPTEFLLSNEYAQHPQVITLMQDYAHYKEERNLYDFEDLILKSTQLLNLNTIKNPYPIVLVDEFQDTSPSQLKLIQAMRSEKLFVVGDDWQSIYKFRGADISIMANFTKTIEGGARLFLTKNFRSQKKIVKLGNQAIQLSKNYIKKKLTSHYKSAQRPVCLIFNEKAYTKNSLQQQWETVASWNQKRNFCTNPTILVRTNIDQHKLRKVIPEKFPIITLHSAKGLEFEDVIIWGIQNTNMPHRWGDLDEEIRLLYVGITRAKSNLQFIAIEEAKKSSYFLGFLVSQCKISYL